MKIRINCPHCKQNFSAEESWIDKELECPKCEEVFLVSEDSNKEMEDKQSSSLIKECSATNNKGEVMYCTNCGSEVAEKAIACTKCGVPPKIEKKFCNNCGVATEPNQAMCTKCGVALKGGSSGTGGKEKTIAGILAILGGAFGLHKFYHGSWGWGILYILLCWVSWILGIIEGIQYLTMEDAEYDEKYNSTEKDPFKW